MVGDVQNMITLREVLDWMDSGQMFSFKAYSCDEKRKIYGNVIAHHSAKLLAHAETDLRPTHTEGATIMRNEVPVKLKRQQNHAKHFTRNVGVGIALGETLKITKIIRLHIDLIVRFNGRQVLLP